MGLDYFDNTANTGSVVESLRRDGAVVVRNLVESGLIDSVLAEFRSRLDASGLNTVDHFNGDRTRRTRVTQHAPGSSSPICWVG